MQLSSIDEKHRQKHKYSKNLHHDSSLSTVSPSRLRAEDRLHGKLWAVSRQPRPSAYSREATPHSLWLHSNRRCIPSRGGGQLSNPWLILFPSSPHLWHVFEEWNSETARTGNALPLDLILDVSHQFMVGHHLPSYDPIRVELGFTYLHLRLYRSMRFNCDPYAPRRPLTGILAQYPAIFVSRLSTLRRSFLTDSGYSCSA